MLNQNGVEIATDNFAFFNPIKLGKDMKEIEYKIKKLERKFYKIVRRNRKLETTHLMKVPIFLGEFAIEMNKVIEEKKEKHKELWKEVPMENLIDLFDEQISEWRTKRHSMHYSVEMRKMIHIANYCCFIYYRLLKTESENNEEF